MPLAEFDGVSIYLYLTAEHRAITRNPHFVRLAKVILYIGRLSIGAWAYGGRKPGFIEPSGVNLLHVVKLMSQETKSEIN